MKHYDQLNIIAESTAYPDKQHDTAVPYGQATYDSLARQGAKGQKPIRNSLRRPSIKGALGHAMLREISL